MNLILKIIGVILFLNLCACTATFKLNTLDFDYYESERKPSKIVNDFQEGIYLFPLWQRTRIEDGIEFDWYEKELKAWESAGTAPVEYAYLVFLDESRVYYYTSLSDSANLLQELFRNNSTYGNVCLSDSCIVKEESNENETSFTQRGISLFEKELMPFVTKELFLNKRKGSKNMRGYYKIESREVERNDTLEICDYVTIEFEIPTNEMMRSGKRKKIPWPSSIKKAKKKKQILEFRVGKDGNSLFLDYFTLPKPRNIARSNKYKHRIIKSEDVLAFTPTFSFHNLTGKNAYKIIYQHHGLAHGIHQIEHKGKDTIFYHLSDGEKIVEVLPKSKNKKKFRKEKQKVMSW